MTDISPKFSIILNPFGEAYPELPSTRDLTPAYQMIKDFIFAGGVFITAAGNPFHYLFNVRDGSHPDTGSVVWNIPISVQEVQDGSGRIQVQIATLLVETLLGRDFGVHTAFLDSKHLPPYASDLFQRAEDRTFWNCQAKIDQIQVFRPLYPKPEGNPVPILRAVIGGEEVFPIGAVRYGSGLLLHIGFALDENNKKEFELAVSAVRDGLIENYDNYFL